MDRYVEFVFVAGPLDGREVAFPEDFAPQQVEFWCRGLKQDTGIGKEPADFFVRYTLDPKVNRYLYSGWSRESDGSDFSEEVYPEVWCNVKGYGRLTSWLPVNELTS
jgi:hypothetical protein